MTRYLRGDNSRKMVAMRLDPVLWNALGELSERWNRSKAELVEMAVQVLLEKQGVKYKPLPKRKRAKK